MVAHTAAVLRNFGLILVLVAVTAIPLPDVGPAAIAGTSIAGSTPVRAGLVSPAEATEPAGSALPVSSSLLTCSASANEGWTTTSESFVLMRDCSLNVPEAGQVFISASGSAAYLDGAYEAVFKLGIDGSIKDYADRWIGTFADSRGGSGAPFAMSTLASLSPGAHTVSLWAMRTFGSGTVQVFDPAITALFIPASSGLLACGDQEYNAWETTSGFYGVVSQCSLTLPEDGWLFTAADGAVMYKDGDYEASFDVGLDVIAGSGEANRYVDAYLWDSRGIDRTMALSLLQPVTAGSHTIYLLGRRSWGSGTVQVIDPALSAIYLPASNSKAVTCGSGGHLNWSTTSGDFQVVRQCSLTTPEAGWAFVLADSSVAWPGADAQPQFRLGVDNTEGEDTDRYVNAYSISGDGRDQSVSITALRQVTAGSHTFNFLARTLRKPGQVLLHDPSLTVIMPVDPLDVPVLSTPSDGALLCNGQPTFTWSGVEGATSHQIQIDDDPAFGTPEIDETVMGASYSVDAGQALGDGIYYWQVRGLTPYQTGPWSAGWRFSVGPPATQVAPIAPADQEILCGPIYLSWNAVDQATGYDIQVDNQAGFSSPEVDESTQDPAFGPAPGLGTETYFWHVRGTNTCGGGPWSDTWQFTISSGTDVPTLLSPADGTTTGDTTPEFRWASVPRGVEYRIMVGRDAAFNSVTLDEYTYDTTFTPATPLDGGTYYWKVRSRDDCASSDWSAPWRLTISGVDHQIYLPLLRR